MPILVIRSERTRLASLSRAPALGVLIGLLAAIAVCMGAIPSALRPIETRPEKSGSDFDLYSAEFDRVRNGEPYYEVLASELRDRNYPMASVFNWRTPAHFTVLAKIGSDTRIALVLGLLALLASLLGFRVVSRESGPVAGAIAFVLLGLAFLPLCFARAWLAAEPVAALLIMLSALFFVDEARGVRGGKLLGVAFGIAALFVRELAVVYVLMIMARAVLHKDRWAITVWTVALTAYAFYLAAHALAVGERNYDAAVSASSWLAFGGLPFVLNTIRVHPVLLGFPPVVTAIAFPIALLGLVAARGAFARFVLLVTIAYGVAFSFLGQPFNSYWGWIDAPLVLLGLAFVPAAAIDLYRAIVSPQGSRNSEAIP